MNGCNHNTALKFFSLLFVSAALTGLLLTGPASANRKLDWMQLHTRHLTEGVDCDGCHKAQLKDQGVKSIYPPAKACLECHDDKLAAEFGYEERSGTRRSILFSHGDHLALDKKCLDCHQGPKDKTISKPGHSACKECHQEDLDATLCAKCHLDFQTIGLQKLSSYSHAADYLKRHPEYARKSSRSCAQCHTESFCLDCHNKHEGLKPSLKYPEKVRANLIHRGDWETAHRLEAKTDSSSCLKCHGVNACNTCHAQRGASARAAEEHFSHPAGWLAKGSKDFHGEKARSEIVSCASCHNRGGKGDCRSCHAASFGLNPHPKGWGEKGMEKSHPMCAECHSK